jgi:hypothetical protein
MAKSRYEKNIVRKAGVFQKSASGKYHDIKVVQPEKTPVKKPDTGPLLMWHPQMVPGTKQLIEYGIISGDVSVGDGGPTTFSPLKTYPDGIFFLMLGTNPDDLNDLGAEAEFWLGEGETLEKIVINTPTCVYVPPGTGRFPLIWKNVRRPCMFVVFVADFTIGEGPIPVDTTGRPMYKGPKVENTYLK